MKEVSRERGLAVRYDGDEFVILMPGADKEKALQLGQELMQLAHERPALDKRDVELPITFSIGVASAPEDAQTGNDLMSKADTALFYAKTSRAGSSRQRRPSPPSGRLPSDDSRAIGSSP